MEQKDLAVKSFLWTLLLTILFLISQPGTILATKTPDAPLDQLPAEASPDWWSAVQKDIRDSEYHVTWQDKTNLPDIKSAWQAPNRAHNLRTYFLNDGVWMIPRTSATCH